jgi:FixJ family two-component response regulator
VAVVDDDESSCRSFSRLLRAAGFQPVTYASAEAFLEDAKRPRFDCLVLDIQLEGMSGLELGQRLVAVRDATPFIFLTAHDEPEMRSEALASRCAGYFRKNDPGALVMQAIRTAVRRATGMPARFAQHPGPPRGKKNHDRQRRPSANDGHRTK